MIQIQCRNCGRRLRVNDNAIGMAVKCPDCDARVNVPKTASPPAVQRHRAELVERPAHKPKRRRPTDVQMSVSHSPSPSNSLGIGSIVLGVLAFSICWIPLVGLISLPLSLLGLLLATIGCVVAIRRRGAGVGFPIAGVAVCGLAAAVTLTLNFMIGAATVGSATVAAEAIQRRAEEIDAAKNVRDNELTVAAPPEIDGGEADGAGSASTDPGLETPQTQWTPAGQVATVEDVSYRIRSVSVGRIDLLQLSERMQSRDALTRIEIEISSHAANKKRDFVGYNNPRTQFLDVPRPTLTDNFGNQYKRIDFGIARPVGQIDSTASLYPGDSVTEVLVFEAPLETATLLRLTLPAEYVVDQTGVVRFEIPSDVYRD